jgi:S-adenosyl-L-methionine hydrolase (adenosine-forming)
MIKTKKAWLVGPDNGLMVPTAERLGIEEIYEIKGHPDFPTKISKVFDGRDTFGPAGALLSREEKPDNIGIPLKDIIRLPSYTTSIEKNTINGEVIHVDGFGNCVTNINYETLEKNKYKNR